MHFLKNKDGFTFIEVLIAVTILFLAVMTVSLLLLQGYQIMASAGKRSESLHLTQEEMEAAIAMRITPDLTTRKLKSIGRWVKRCGSLVKRSPVPWLQ